MKTTWQLHLGLPDPARTSYRRDHGNHGPVGQGLDEVLAAQLYV
jgi:hypothetical protein